MFTITKISTESIPQIERLSSEIWHKVYPLLITTEQIDFMLNMMYSRSSLEKQILELEHQFILISTDEEAVGYASYSLKSAAEPTIFRLNKLYLQPACHGQGMGKAMIQFIIAETLPQGAKFLELNVNKENPTVAFYKKFGFTITEETVVQIGEGYVMDDFVMTLKIAE
jgi:GNAT superfamily N-acetyltransferase